MPGLSRAARDILSAEALGHARYIPRIIRRVRPWPRFLLTYMRLLNTPAEYRISGLRFYANPIDVSTLAVVFIKEDYGASVDGVTVIDIGANIGAFALLAATNPRARVRAYEPVESTYRQLVDNIQRNGLQDRVEAFQLGVAGSTEARTITVSPHGSPFSTMYGTGPGEPIECVDLAAVLDGIDRCDILKLDCEGAEFEILHNAPPDTLARIDRIWLEYHERPGHTADTLTAHLAAHGFQVQHRHLTHPHCGTLHLTRSSG